MSSGRKPEVWPAWLADDIPGLGVWSIEHDSAPTLWRGHAMPLVDRANNILPLLLQEERLAHGDIAFVTHSFGGLILQQILRIANDRSAKEPGVADFLRRIGRITFLATPHRGASLATWASIFGLVVRPSSATKELPRNEPHLRELNYWFRQYAGDNGLAIQTLTETKPALFCLVVPPDSADAGSPSQPIPLDVDHFSIASPASRKSETYIHVKNFLTAAGPTRQRHTVGDNDILHGIAAATATATATLGRIEKSLEASAVSSSPPPAIPPALVDDAVLGRLTRLRRSRFFVGAQPADNASRLAAALCGGDLASASPTIRARGLAWCARILISARDSPSVPPFLGTLRSLADIDDVLIAEAFAQSHEGDLQGALAKLSIISSPTARSAAFAAVRNERNSDEGLAWLAKSGLTPADLDSDGRFFVIAAQLDTGLFDQAMANAVALTPVDFEQTPALWYLAATAQIASVAPRELARMILSQPAFTMAHIPLADDVAALETRRKARLQYSQAADAAAEFECLEARHDAMDRALVLRLRDPRERKAALTDLERSMRLPEHSLRRVPIALWFNLKIDLRAVEHDIDRVMTLSGGHSSDAALARLAVAQAKNPKECAAYIQKHRSELTRRLNPAFVAGVEIQSLIESNQLPMAEECLVEILSDDFTDEERARLSRIVADARASNPTAAREKEFRSTDKLIDLERLVEALERDRDWARLTKYGAILFRRRRDLASCRLYVRSLWESANFQGVVDLLGSPNNLLSSSQELQSMLAWSHYNLGNMTECLHVLEKLQKSRDEQEDRFLFVNVAIMSGEWHSLASFVEREWERREKRDATELLRAGQIAQQLGSDGAGSLIAAAAAAAPSDPHVLLGCYETAMAAGWEDAGTFRWLEHAAKLSTSDGPVQEVSLKDLIARQPDWQRRESEGWDQLHAGRVPMVACARMLNRTLVQLSLLPALANVETNDPRRRMQLYTYSGARQVSSERPKSIVIDPTALLTAGAFGILERIVGAVDKILIPHSTLGWLFEEKQRLRFHQPTRVAEARELRRLVDAGALKPTQSSVPTDEGLAREIGDELAQLFGKAAADEHPDRGPSRVVRSAPIHRVASLMDEEADLGSYRPYVCGCLDVIDALVLQGRLTRMEERRARTFLNLHETPWPESCTIRPGTVLHMDSVSLSYFQHLRLLPKLDASGFTVVIPAGVVADADRLIRHEALTDRATAVIDHVRSVLSKGISEERIFLGPRPRTDDARNDGFDHPGIDVVRIAPLVDAAVIDDRYFNQHSNILSEGGENVPILTTYDLLSALQLSEDQHMEYLAQMRAAGLAFVPVKRDELDALLSQATIVDGTLVETAELKALRENLQLCRMSSGLQLSHESSWLESLVRVLVEMIQAQWCDNNKPAVSAARSAWLLALLDIRGWSHRYTDAQERDGGQSRFRAQQLRLMMLGADVPAAGRTEYWAWLEFALLSRGYQQRGELDDDLIRYASNFIKKVITRDMAEDDGDPGTS